MKISLRLAADLTTGSIAHTGDPYVTFSGPTPGTQVVCGEVGWHHRLSLLDEKGQLLTKVDLPGSHRINDVSFESGGNRVAIARGQYDGGWSYEGNVLIWDRTDGSLMPVLKGEGVTVLTCVFTETGGLDLRVAPWSDDWDPRNMVGPGEEGFADDDDDDDEEIEDDLEEDEEEWDQLMEDMDRVGQMSEVERADLEERERMLRARQDAHEPSWDEAVEIHYEVHLSAEQLNGRLPLDITLRLEDQRHGFGEGSISRRVSERRSKAEALTRHLLAADVPRSVEGLAWIDEEHVAVALGRGTLEIWHTSGEVTRFQVLGDEFHLIKHKARTVLVADTLETNSPDAASSVLYGVTVDGPAELYRFSDPAVYVRADPDDGLEIVERTVYRKPRAWRLEDDDRLIERRVDDHNQGTGWISADESQQYPHQMLLLPDGSGLALYQAMSAWPDEEDDDEDHEAPNEALLLRTSHPAKDGHSQLNKPSENPLWRTTLSERVEEFLLLSAGSALAVSSHALMLIETTTGQQVAREQGPFGQQMRKAAAQGGKVAVAGQEGELTIWELG